MKKIYILLLAIYFTISHAPLTGQGYYGGLQLQYEWLNAQGEYDAAQAFETRDITSDYGPRRVGTLWHKGIDYRPYRDLSSGHGGLGNALISPVNGTVIGIRGGDNQYKHIRIRTSPLPPLPPDAVLPHGFGYGHLFHRFSGEASTTGHVVGKFVLKRMDGDNNNRYAIINTATGVAIGAPVLFPATVTYDGEVYTVTNQVTAGQAIAPMGNSGDNHTFIPHLHLDLFRDVTLTNFTANASAPNRLDPWIELEHQRTEYQVLWNHRQGGAPVETPNIALTYPGTSPTQFSVRSFMHRARHPESGALLGLNGQANRYRDAALNIDDVEIQLTNTGDNGWITIKGPAVDAKISHGGRENSELYPRQNGMNVTTPISGVPTWDRQGIKPYAYDDNEGYPYDEYYFTDFYTRIHKDDPQQGAGQMMVANCPNNARYNDGVYVMRAKMTDVRGAEHKSSPAFVTLDNFKPYIQAISFSVIPSEGAQPILQYERKWQCSGDCITLSPSPSLSVSKSDWYNLLNPSSQPVLRLKATPSEPLNWLKIKLDRDDGTVIANGLAPDSWDGGDAIFEIGAYIYDLNGKVNFHFTGQDESGNYLLGFTAAHQAPDACVNLPVRTSTGWANDNIPNGENVTDNAHSICIDCGGRSPNENCAVIALISDEGEECLEVEATIVNASSYSASDGSVSLEVSGGVQPYNFIWSNGSTGSGISGLSPGLYRVTITDALCCEVEQEYFVTTCFGQSGIYVDGNVTEPTGISSNGAVDISLINYFTGSQVPSGSYAFSWIGPNGFTSSSEDVSGLPPGNYCVEVRDIQSGCLVSSRCFSVCGPLIIGIRHNGFVDCDGELGTFEVLLLEQNLASPYTVAWSNGATSTVNEGLLPGMYCVTVTDNNGCSDFACQRMRVNYPVEISGQVNHSGCGAANGAIQIIVNSPNSEIATYQWSNGSTSQNIAGLAPGEYCVTISNSQGCAQSACFTVESDELVIGLTSITNPTHCSEPPCAQLEGCTADGAIDITVQSTFSPVTYQWSGPDGFTASTEDIAGLIPGTYR